MFSINKLWCSVLVGTIIFAYELASFLPFVQSKTNLCSQSAVESFKDSCEQLQISTNVSHRIKTIRDLAWLVTPRSYFITHGNQFTFRSMYETLFGSCTPNLDQLTDLQAGIDFDMRNMILFAEPTWQTDTSKSLPFLHLICDPIMDPNMWQDIYSRIYLLPSKNFVAIEAVLNKMTAQYPQLKESETIQQFARLKCYANPVCKGTNPDKDECSVGVQAKNFETWDITVTWTDHISDTRRSGTGFLVEGCLSGDQYSYLLFSIVPNQSVDNINEFQSYLSQKGYSPRLFAFGYFDP